MLGTRDLRGEPIAALGEGWDSLAVRVGEGWVFRFARRALAARRMANEIRWAPVLAPLLPVPIPVPERIRSPSADHPFPYVGHRWVAGETGCRAGLDADGRGGLAPALGRFLRVLHGIGLPSEPPVGTPGRSDHVYRGKRALDRLVELLDPPTFARVREVIEASFAVAPARSRTWVHGDLYGRHLLIGDDRSLVGVIDWGDVQAGDPAIDPSIAWSSLPAGAREALFAAYGPVDPETRARARVVASDSAGALIP